MGSNLRWIGAAFAATLTAGCATSGLQQGGSEVEFSGPVIVEKNTFETLDSATRRAEYEAAERAAREAAAPEATANVITGTAFSSPEERVVFYGKDNDGKAWVCPKIASPAKAFSAASDSSPVQVTNAPYPSPQAVAIAAYKAYRDGGEPIIGLNCKPF